MPDVDHWCDRAVPLTTRSVRPIISERVVVGVVYVLALSLTLLDSSIVTVSLPTLSRDFHEPTTSVEWVVTGYLLSLAVWIPSSGWIGDRFGAKRTMLTALGAFTMASLLCGIATSMPELVAFRIVQGVGGGMLTPIGSAMLFRAFPPERRAVASRILIIPVAIAPASGPLVGGFLIDQLSWRWIFWINLPIGLAAWVFGLLFLTEHREPTAGRFDLAGFALSAAGLGSVFYSVSQGPVVGWADGRVVATAAAGSVALVALVVVELRVTAPMLNLRLLQHRLFRWCNSASVFSTAAWQGLLFIVPTYLQTVRGTSAFQSGLTTFGEAIGALVMAQVVGRLYPRIGPRRLMITGLVGMSLTAVGIASTGLSTSLRTIAALMFLGGCSLAFMIISLQTASFADVDRTEMGRATAIFGAQRQTAAALGVAVLATSLAGFLPEGHGAGPVAAHEAYQKVFLVAAAIALVGVVAASRIRDRDAAGTMAPRSQPAEPLVHVEL